MDISLDYIEMCSKAQEIQKLRNQCFKNGDYIYINTPKEQIFESPIDDVFVENICICPNIPITHTQFGNEFKVTIYYCWWLPKQDQLQKMIIKEGVAWDIVRYFFRKMDGSIANYYIQFPSMEQLWLAFVMKEKYNKQWNFETKEWEIIISKDWKCKVCFDTGKYSTINTKTSPPTQTYHVCDCQNKIL